MSQSEDYLDGLLNSINKAKTDVVQVEENAQKKQQEIVESRKAISPEDDFFAATGINAEETHRKSSHPYLRKVLSEDDFLREFEEEMLQGDTDAFLESFEKEIDDEERSFEETGKMPESEGVVRSLLDDIDEVVDKAKQELDDEPRETEVEDNAIDGPEYNEAVDDVEIDNFSLEDAMSSERDLSSEINETDSQDDAKDDGSDDLDNLDLDNLMDNIEEPELTPIEEDEPNLSDESEVNETSDDGDDLGFSLDDALGEDGNDEPLDESLKEFMPDEMDALDAAEFGDGNEEPDLSGDGDLDLENLLGEDEDLMDIQSLLEEEGVPGGDLDLDTEAETTADEESSDDGKKGKKKKKEKKDKKAKGEKKPNPIIEKLLLIIFGPPDEDEIAEMEAEKAAKEAALKPVEITYDEDGNPIVPETTEEDGKKKKEKKKKEKPPKEKKEKKEKPPKEPKPKKEKKPKEPDNSPKIPIPIIATFLVLSISIIGVVLVGMNYMGLKRHMAEAMECFEAKDYISAYEKLNGFDLTDDDDILVRNQARVLADVQQCQNEYESFIEYQIYDFALDSLIKGVGRYEKYKDEAEEYGISEEYDAYGQLFISELSETYGLSEEEALEIFNQKNRHYYTVELRKVLIRLGLE